MTDKAKQIKGSITDFRGAPHYHIAHVDQMPPFLMSVVSPFDHWMYIMSNGALTAGRQSAGQALFPYYTEDKLAALAGQQGAATQAWVLREGETIYWAPFHFDTDPFQQVERHLYKKVWGHEVTFVEMHRQLEALWQYTLGFSETFGIVRKATMKNEGTSPLQFSIMDGFRQLLPAGADPSLQAQRSNLLSAYKKNEWHGPLALYRLSAVPIDRAEPAESLVTNVVWQWGPEPTYTTLRHSDWRLFTLQKDIPGIAETKGEEGAFLRCDTFTLSPGEERSWWMVADTRYDAAKVQWLFDHIAKQNDDAFLEDTLKATTARWHYLLSVTDGIQTLGNANAQYRHANNVIFNDMRGGLLLGGPTCPVEDLKAYLEAANKEVYERNTSFLAQIPDRLPLDTLRQKVIATRDKDLIRLVLEYLPIGFSRRHGDPSRPWNTFHIRVKSDQGWNILNYEGNWRDIFQNWEALSHTFPELLPAMVAKFWNATTIDGYNPYRINKDGVDWEIHDPADPWSYVGYWGDHQIVYLNKLLERWQQVAPGAWTEWMDADWFSTPDVPYRIKTDQEIFENAADTITFDDAAHAQVMQRAEEIGFDGKNRQTSSGHMLTLNGAEKCLISISAKLDNLIPAVGIWMNTQRPEWNDANNALVGRGASAVTVYQLRKYLTFLRQSLSSAKHDRFPIATAILHHWRSLIQHLTAYLQHKDPMTYLKAAQSAGARYRKGAYGQALGTRKDFSKNTWLADMEQCIAVLDATIAANRREDGMYHAYHLVQTNGQTLDTQPLYLMLEGQAAILDAQVLAAEDVSTLLEALRKSALFEPRQQSYLLYPDRDLPLFMERNWLEAEKVEKNTWMVDILQDKHQQILVRHPNGQYQFHPLLYNAKQLRQHLQPYYTLPSYSTAKEAEVLDWYESIFNHRAFTGRSGTFYGYEGLGSIYWHMVSKLVLATRQMLTARQVATDSAVGKKLWTQYAALREGIGWNKSPEIYGAIPIDPYSHTPKNKGARQPGMTGQVKEDLICRWMDLGVVLDGGRISFHMTGIPDAWWTKKPTDQAWQMEPGSILQVHLAPQSIAFSYSGVVVVYYRKEPPAIVTGQENIVIHQPEVPMAWDDYVNLRQKKVLAIPVEK